MIKQLIKCEACEKEISQKAKQCPECGHPVKKKKSALMLPLQIVLGVMILLVIIGIFNSPKKEEKQLSATIDDSNDLVEKKDQAKIESELKDKLMIACSNIIQNTLKYPSSYSQPWGDIMQVVRKGEDDYLVRVPFEAKNGFGNEIPQVGYCASDGVNTTLLQVENR